MKVSKGSKILIIGGIVLIIGCLCIYNMVAYETQTAGYDQKYTPITLDVIAMFYLQNFWLFSAIETLVFLYIGIRIARWYMTQVKATMKEAIKEGIKEGIKESSEEKK